MSWADAAIERLKEGETVVVKPHGNSMTPRIKSGQEVVVVPVDLAALRVNDVVLVRVFGKVYLHLIRQVSRTGNLFQIANNKGRVNGWVTGEHVYGKADV